MGKAGSTSTYDFFSPAHPGNERIVVTVVGVGNGFRGDDAVGLMVLRELKEKVPAGARTIELEGDQSHLLELMRSTDAMIIVDAVQSSAPAGTIFRLDAADQPLPGGLITFSTHAVDTMTAVELARTLGLLPEIVLIYGIVGRKFGYSTELTAEVAEAVEVVQERILNDVNQILSEELPLKK